MGDLMWFFFHWPIGFMYQLTRFFLAKRVALCLKEACRSLSIDQAIDSSIDWSWSSVSAAWTCEYVFLSLRIMCCCLFFPCVFLSRNETTTAAAALQSMNKNWKKREKNIIPLDCDCDDCGISERMIDRSVNNNSNKMRTCCLGFCTF